MLQKIWKENTMKMLSNECVKTFKPRECLFSKILEFLSINNLETRPLNALDHRRQDFKGREGPMKS